MDEWGSEDSALLYVVRNANKHKSRNRLNAGERVYNASTYFNELERISAKYDMCSANIHHIVLHHSCSRHSKVVQHTTQL